MSVPYPNPLIECVVNVSEGRDLSLLDRMADTISGAENCYLLHRDTGYGAHRTVFTFAGSPDAVFEAAYQLYAVAVSGVDMRLHEGRHPRAGAIDVCPFVPMRDISMQEVAARTRVLGQRVAQEFGIPVFLYAESASDPGRADLAAIRRGEFEGLSEKLRRPEWQPDFGPATPHPTQGIAIMGARPYLIAWNINLEPTATLQQATQLAGRLRGSGVGGRAGLFPGLKAIGWYIPEYGRCQVSCNVVDVALTDLARIYLTASAMATGVGTRVSGSELIGLIPSLHLRAAARNFCRTNDEEEMMETAVTVLGLADLSPFNWRSRSLEGVYHDAEQRDRQSR